MSTATLLLFACTTRHRYVVRRDQIAEIRLIRRNSDLALPDARGRTLVCQELGPLLDPLDVRRSVRCHALIVATRRRSVALLVERLDDFVGMAPEAVQRLSPLLARHLARPWVLGALVCDDIPLLVLDLRQIAQDVLLGIHTMHAGSNTDE